MSLTCHVIINVSDVIFHWNWRFCSSRHSMEIVLCLWKERIPVELFLCVIIPKFPVFIVYLLRNSTCGKSDYIHHDTFFFFPRELEFLILTHYLNSGSHLPGFLFALLLLWTYSFFLHVHNGWCDGTVGSELGSWSGGRFNPPRFEYCCGDWSLRNVLEQDIRFNLLRPTQPFIPLGSIIRVPVLARVMMGGR